MSAGGGPLFIPQNAARPYPTAIGLVSCECAVGAGLRRHSSPRMAWARGTLRGCTSWPASDRLHLLPGVRASAVRADGDKCEFLFNQTRYGKPGVYTDIASLRLWIDSNIACLQQPDFEQCSGWEGTCFDFPQGCLTCQSTDDDDGNPTQCATCALKDHVVDAVTGKVRGTACSPLAPGLRRLAARGCCPCHAALAGCRARRAGSQGAVRMVAPPHSATHRERCCSAARRDVRKQ